jgi:chromosome segregation ATPase
VEKYMRLSHTYSSDNTISGEKCYMVDEALYKDILLAVAARKQNESTLSSASEKLEQHLVQIEDSHKRIMQRENVVIEQFVAEIALSQEKIKLGHTARMQAVMADIRTLKNSVASTSELDQNSPEMKRLRFQVTQYESILPVYQSRLKDTEDLNRKLVDEKSELNQNIERLKQKLDKAESLVFSMGTPEAIKQRGPIIPVMGSSGELFPRLFPSPSQEEQN